MGAPVNFIYMNRLVRFCCGGCEAKLIADPGNYMAELDKAYADAQRADYPLDTCPVSEAELGSKGEPAELVAGTRLFRFCCDSCFAEFRKDPQEYLAKLPVACPPKTDPVSMRVPMGHGLAQETLGDETDEAHTGADHHQAA